MGAAAMLLGVMIVIRRPAAFTGWQPGSTQASIA
jgi:hypothetical protein